ncbi:hypothetical protein B7O87_02240 [Cylindrospermopsis raciborskii CENA303]|uniref:Uncharacterized protein n=1 Tax=Cylindrospermopsis raciborskii CENA303 TaxID=1170769 RepID=A0A1X4GBR4_9CYAN|nr:hypothetical protein B7O87_02240 [Cylindrospermopsis raciborskii CENA303]
MFPPNHTKKTLQGKYYNNYHYHAIGNGKSRKREWRRSNILMGAMDTTTIKWEINQGLLT